MSDLNKTIGSIIERGRAETPEFDEHCAYVVGISANPDEVRHVIAGLGDDAHKVVSHLADDPDEAARILSLRGAKMGAELGRFAARATTRPAAASKVPAAPPAAATPKPGATPDLYDPKLSTKEWAREWDRQQAEKREQRISRAKEDRALFARKR